MAKKNQSSRDHDEGKTFTPETQQFQKLPADPGDTVLWVDERSVVIVAQKGDGGGDPLPRPKITVCKCSKMGYVCSPTPAGTMVCREQCVEWECTQL